MTILITEGFDLYNGVGVNTGLLGRWSSSGVGASAMTAGRFGSGTQALRVAVPQFTAADLLLGLGSTPFLNLSVGFAWRYISGANNQNFLTLRNNSTVIASLNYDIASAYWFKTQGGTVQSSPGTWITNTWYYLELEVVVALSGARISLYRDGDLMFNSAGLNLGSTGINLIAFGATMGAGFNNAFDIDDLYVADVAARLGPQRIDTLRPVSDVSSLWTPSAGQNWDAVNDATVDGDGTYVATGTVGARDVYEFENLPGNPIAINAVNSVFFGRKTDAAYRGVQGSLQSGGVDDHGRTHGMLTGYGRYDTLRELNFNGAVAWNKAAVDALRAGPRLGA